MNTERLHEILRETTGQFRKGEEVTTEQSGGINVTHVFMMPPENEMREDLVKIDVYFMVIGVDRAKAVTHRQELVGLLMALFPGDLLGRGPSYITVGGEIGDQGAAFQLFALGKVLGLWDLITPATFGAEGADAERMAGAGYIMISGFNP